MISGSALVFFVALILQGPGGAAPGDLAAAKALYAMASYEEALSHLSTIKDNAPVEQVEQYRALCLLALGRTADAERSIERIVLRTPLYKMTDADVSPRLVTMFRDVRKRLLPAAAKDLYTNGKTHFDQKRYADASGLFKNLLAILTDDGLAGQAAAELADLKMLGEGFLKLSDAALAAPKDPPPPRIPPEPAPPVVKPAPKIYSSDDRDVVAPVDVDRKLPPWNPPSPVASITANRGLLELIIDERGAVESAVLRTSVSRFYDAGLLEAARKWRFRPATRNGEPVKYRKHVVISLSG